MPRRNDYSEDQRLAAVAYVEGCGGNIARAARETKIPRKTLEYWVNGGGIDPENGELRHQKRNDLAALFEAEAMAGVKRAQDVRHEATYAQLMTGAAIAVDKAVLLREKMAVSPERFNQGMELVQRLLIEYVTDPAALEEIHTAFREFLRGDGASDSEGEGSAGEPDSDTETASGG